MTILEEIEREASKYVDWETGIVRRLSLTNLALIKALKLAIKQRNLVDQHRNSEAMGYKY